MQEILSSNSPVVTEICDPNKSRARHHRSLKLASKLKYLKRNVFYRVTCSVFTEIDTSALKYLARYSSINSIFDWIIQPQFSYLLLLHWFSFVWDLKTPSCSSSLLAAYKKMKLESYWLFVEIFLRLNYILVILMGYILLICTCLL